MRNTYITYFMIAFLAVACTVQVALASPGNPAPENVGMYSYSTITLTTASTLVVARNAARNLLFIQNTGGTNAAVIKPGSGPSSATDGIVLNAGNTFIPVPAMVDAFYARSSTSTTTLTIIEALK